MNLQARRLFAQAAATFEAGNFAAAEALLGDVVSRDPRAHEAWNALAELAVRGGNAELAVMRARRATELDRRNPVYLNTLGVARGEMLAYEEAESAFRRALKLKPVYPEAVFNLGKVLRKQGRLQQALREYERAFAMAPELPRLRLALSAFLRNLGRVEQAAALLTDASGEVPGSCVSSYAQCLVELNGAQSALQWLGTQEERRRESRELRFFRAGLLLSLGDWRQGWELYASRPSVERAPNVQIAPLPRELAGERILLRSEQGLGDVLFFLRFAAELRARGAKLALQVPTKLLSLLQDIELIEEGAPCDEASFDRAFWIGDLPAALEAATTPPPVALEVEEGLREEAFRRLSALGPAPYLGVTWRAGTELLRRREFADPDQVLSKEIAPALLGQALQGWPGTVVVLQRNPDDHEVAAFAEAAGRAVHDLSALNEDLPRMVALLAALQEHVCVSNTNVHLAAGIRAKARVLVPQPYEWRWMEDGESPWFPGFPIYRQPPSRDWSAPLARLREELFA